jgi:hypothetical protein
VEEDDMNTRLLSGISLVVAVGVIGITGLAFPEIVFANENAPSPTITVRIYNYSQAAPATLSKAEREADRILGEAGLRAVWLECKVDWSTANTQGLCNNAVEATDIRLRILSVPIQNRYQDTVFGFVVHPVLASVYYEYVVRLSKQDDADFELPIILGCAIAHEIGHLLLGSDSHSGMGIMQRKWQREELRQAMMGRLLFTVDQSNLIRAEARRRTLATSAALP